MLTSICEVVENHACTGCGTCAGVCPALALEMVETPAGNLVPELKKERCTRCGVCDKVCPQINPSSRMQGSLSRPLIGKVCSAWLGESTDRNVACEGQTGGLARSLLEYSLASGLAKRAICVMDNPAQPLRPIVEIISEPERALSSARSKYCPIAVNSVIRNMLEIDGPIVYVELGCHMQGLHLAMEQLSELRKKVVLKIGLFCDRVLNYRAVDYLLRCAGIDSKDVAEFDYRHKSWRGWPGDVRIVTGQGRTIDLSRRRRGDSRGLFTPIHCRLCVDKLNALSDISLGDPYGIIKSQQVPTAALVRSSAGRDVLAGAEKAGRITLTPADAEEIVRNQKMNQRDAHCFAFVQEMRRRRFELSWFHDRAVHESDRKRRRPIWVRWAVGLALSAETSKGRRIIRSIRPFIVTLWGLGVSFRNMVRRKIRDSCRTVRSK